MTDRAQIMVTSVGSSTTSLGITLPVFGSQASSSATVSGSGIVAITTYANLYFGSGGKIEKLAIKLGDRVTKGMVLAKLDTASLAAALTQAKVTLDQAQLTRTQANDSLQTAQTILDKTRVLADAKKEIINLNWQMKILEMMMQDPGSSNATYTGQQIVGLRNQITTKTKSFSNLLAQTEFTGVVTSYDITNAKYDTLTTADIKVKELQVKSACVRGPLLLYSDVLPS